MVNKGVNKGEGNPKKFVVSLAALIILSRFSCITFYNFSASWLLWLARTLQRNDRLTAISLTLQYPLLYRNCAQGRTSVETRSFEIVRESHRG